MSFFTVFCLQIFTCFSDHPPAALPDTDWPGLRGYGDSLARSQHLPLSWSDQELAWSATLSGYGQSAPVIHAGRAFVTSVSGPQQDLLIVAAYDLATGRPIWLREFPSSRQIPSGEMFARAASTPFADDSGVYAFFGSGDLIKLDADGNSIWTRALTEEYGPFQGNHGVGSSPVCDETSLYLLADHEGPSYLLAIDKQNGMNRWRVERQSGMSYTTPLLTHLAGKACLVISSSGTATTCDRADGSTLWQVDGLVKNSIPSPARYGDLIILGSSEKGECVAINGVAGENAPVGIVWKSQVSSSFGSPLVYQDGVYFVNKSGIVSCVDPKVGSVRWQQRVGDACWATPIGAAGRLYFFCTNGETWVLDALVGGPRVLAVNKLTLKNKVYGVAAARDGFLIRTGTRLIKVGSGG